MAYKNIVVIGSLAAAASLGFLAAYLLYDNPQMAGKAHGSPDHTAVKAELAELQAQVKRMDAALSGEPDMLARGNSRANMAPRPIEGMPSEAEMAQQRQKRRAAYDVSFNNQQVDPAWASSTETALMDSMVADQVLNANFEIPDLREIKCRSNMCRMKFEFKESADATDWADTYLTELGGGAIGKTWYTMETRPDGSTELLMYGFK